MGNKFFLLLSLILASLACKKDADSKLDGDLHIRLTIDGKAFEKVYPPTIVDMGNGYTYCSYTMCGKGYGAGFDLDATTGIMFTFGQLSSSQQQVTFEMFKSLFAKGEKIYDSLNTMMQSNSNRVEVAYIDNGKWWRSTPVTFDSIGHVIQHAVHQPGSHFIIDDVKDVIVNGQPGGVRFKGHFNCILYEENGNGQKHVASAEFLAQVIKL